MSLVLTDETGQTIEFDKLIKHKENILPIRQGRSVSQLHQIVDMADKKPTPGLSINTDIPDPTKTITGTSQQRQNKMNIEECHEFYENELNTTTSTDILSIWCQYIETILTLTYSSSSRGVVLPCIEAMINHICVEPKLLAQYCDDQRFLKYCYLLCESVVDPLRIYRFLQAKSIGQKDAKFFLNYSSILYINQHYRGSMEVLYNAIKNQVHPIAHLKNRYKYLAECEKSRLSKILKEPVDDKRLQQLVKSKDPQTIGKLYNFSYDSQRDNILSNGSNDSNVNNNPNDNLMQRGLSVIYKDGHKPQESQPIRPSKPTSITSPTIQQQHNNNNNNTTNSNDIYEDSDDDHLSEGEQAINKKLMEPIISHSRLASQYGKRKENKQPYTSDFSLAYDTEYLQDLDEHNKLKNIHAKTIGSTVFELPSSHVTTDIYCDDDEE